LQLDPDSSYQSKLDSQPLDYVTSLRYLQCKPCSHHAITSVITCIRALSKLDSLLEESRRLCHWFYSRPSIIQTSVIQTLDYPNSITCT
jgi:hypothetical protein